MDDMQKPSLIIDEKDRDLPRGAINLPKDPPVQSAPAVKEAPVPDAELPFDNGSVAASMRTKKPVPANAEEAGEKSPSSIADRIVDLKDQGTAWFKQNKFLGSLILLLLFGFLLYFWPLITCVLVAAHMMKNTKGTENKVKIYKIVAILSIVAISVQALWMVQLAQATSFGR